MINRVRVVFGLAINTDGEILLQRRAKDGWVPDAWDFVGDVVERAEGDERALTRAWTGVTTTTSTVGHRVGRIHFDCEQAYVFSLFHVKFVQPLVVRADVSVQWVAPRYAVERFTCAPWVYLLYPQVKSFVANHR